MKLGFRLLCITDRHSTNGRDLTDVIAPLIHAGLRGLQIREKDMPNHQFALLAERIRNLADGMPARLFINSRIDLAQTINAGLHLPDRSDVDAARKILGPHWPIGVSCHCLQSALAAEKAGASFVLLGPVFPAISKHTSTHTLGLAALSEISASITIPVVAVGGITPENARDCLSAGAVAVASVGALMGADDPQRTLLHFMRTLGRL